jgi:hypothetical protein
MAKPVTTNATPGPGGSTISQPSTNGDQQSPSAGIGALIEETQAITEMAKEVFARTSRLATALKRYRKQSRLVSSTLASLRQLQKIEN